MLLALQLNNLLGEPPVLVEVPDVVGETQAAGTAELEGEGFSVSVVTAYSDLVAVGLIISQVPAGGVEGVEGSTVTITVSLGPEPVVDAEPIGGHYYPTKPPKKPKDYRPEQDERRQREERELREAVQRAALVNKAKDALTEAQERAAIEPPSTVPRTKRLRVFRRQVASLEKDFAEIKADLAEPNHQALHTVNERLKALIAKAADELVSQAAEVLIDLIKEITEDDDAA